MLAYAYFLFIKLGREFVVTYSTRNTLARVWFHIRLTWCDEFTPQDSRVSSLRDLKRILQSSSHAGYVEFGTQPIMCDNDSLYRA